MIILRKKRLLVIAIGLILAVGVFSFTNTSFHKTEKTVPTVSFPVSNKTIILDAGHGIPDEGAQSSSRNNRSTN